MVTFEHNDKFRCGTCWKEYDIKEMADKCCTGFLANVPINGCCPKCQKILKVTKSHDGKYTDFDCRCGWSGRSS